MFNFQLVCEKKYKAKNETFLNCQQVWKVCINLYKFKKKLMHSKERFAPPEVPLFFISRSFINTSLIFS